MSSKTRRLELSRLNLLFCLMVVFIHCASHPVSVLEHGSWQYGVMLCAQRLLYVSVTGFFFLSGVKLTLGKGTPPPYPVYLWGRVKHILLPYLLSVAVYYLYFVAHDYFPFSLGDLAGHALRGDLSSPFYFVVALMQFILLSPLFRWLSRRWSPVVLLPLALGITWMSSQQLNGFLSAALPGLDFPYPDRLFTSYLVYYLAGCCAGQHYERFLALLEKNRPLLLAAAGALLAGDVYFSWVNFVLGRQVQGLEMLHALYQLAAIPALYALSLTRTRPLPALARRMDRASYLVYLYHALAIVIFNDWAYQQGIQRVSVQLLLRLPVVYGAVFGLAILFQGALGAAKKLRPLNHL